YREKRSGDWQDEPVEENLVALGLQDMDGFMEPAKEALSVDVISRSILRTYAFSIDKVEISAATEEHPQLLTSKNTYEVITGPKSGRSADPGSLRGTLS